MATDKGRTKKCYVVKEQCTHLKETNNMFEMTNLSVHATMCELIYYVK